MKLWVGIDIGKKGAIVMQTDAGNKGLAVMPMIKDEVDYHEVVRLLRTFNPETTHVVFERLQAIFRTSKGSAFSLGHQAGAVEMACISLGLSFTKVGPKIWQKEMFEGIPLIKKAGSTSNDTKAMALLAVKRLLPDQVLTMGKATKPHEGIVDALLMSEYCKRHF